MKITGAEFGYFRIPLAETLVSASFTLTHRELVTVEISTDGRVSGTGWFTTPGVGAAAAMRLAQEHMAPLLIGQDPRNHELLWKRLWSRCHYAGPGGLTTLAISGIDIALWDIKGKLAGEPLHRLLGGSRDAVGVYASSINLHLEKDRLLEQVEGQLQAGYQAFKIKLGRATIEEDLDRCKAVRALIGPGRDLMLDVNQKWRGGEARQALALLGETKPLFIEEPLLSDDVAGHTQLRRASNVPVAVGEQLCNRYDFWNYVREEAADYLQPCVWKVGGITEWLKVAALAGCANLMISPHGALELSVHLAAAVPNSDRIENIFGVGLHELQVTTVETPIVNGMMTPPDAPGHGVVLDGPALTDFRVD